MDYSKLQGRAEKLHRAAKNGTLKHGSELYRLTFNHYHGHYEVTNQAGDEVSRLNTRKITQARKWLKEWLEN